jgi:hypothetical protein
MKTLSTQFEIFISIILLSLVVGIAAAPLIPHTFDHKIECGTLVGVGHIRIPINPEVTVKIEIVCPNKTKV